MKTNDDLDLLKIEQHSLVQKLLHVSKSARLDLQVTIGYLCTQVKCPNHKDWKKLKHLLQYIYSTINMKQNYVIKFVCTNEHICGYLTCTP